MYDYEEAVREDIVAALSDYEESLDDEDEVLDYLEDCDSVTGNASGSYWCNAYRAKECIFGDNNAEDYIREVIDDYCMHGSEVAEHLFDWEYWDVMIRIHVLHNVLSDVLDDLRDNRGIDRIAMVTACDDRLE